jgi:WD40 repeat protein
MTGPRGQVDGIALAPDGRTLAVVSHAGEVRELAVFETATGRPARAVKVGAGDCSEPVLSPNGSSVAVASIGGNTVRIWDYATLTERRAVKLRLPAGMLSFSPDGRTLRGVMLATGGEPTPFSIDTEAGKVTEYNALSATNLSWLCYSPDGRLLAVGGQGGAGTPILANVHGAIRLYEAGTEKLVREFADVNSLPTRLAFSPDGKRLASGAWDGTVIIWDVATGKRLREFPGHRGRVVSLAFSPDGKRLASGSIDTTVLVWDVGNMPPAPP